MPTLAVLDPELTVGLPPAVTAATGMDALCHAVESYTNATYCTALEDDYARQAVRLIFDNLPQAFTHGDDLVARQNLQKAAFLAGRALTFIARIEHLNEQLGMPERFSCIRDEDVPQMVAWSDAEANPLYPVPVVWCRSDFERLIAQLR